MEIMELMFDEVSETDPYERSIEPSKLIIKKDISGFDLTEIYSGERYSEIQNNLGIKIKVYNEPSIGQLSWDDVTDTTANEMTENISRSFIEKIDSIEKSSQKIDLVYGAVSSLEGVYQTAYEIQEILKKSFSKVRELAKTADHDDIVSLSLYTTNFIESSNKVNEFFKKSEIEMDKILESERLLTEFLNQIKDIKMNFMSK